MSLRILPEAELISAALWYEDQQTGVGGEFLSEAQAGIHYISEHINSLPHLEWYSGRYDIRRRLLKKIPYAIIVVKLVEEFVIVAICHTRRRPLYWLTRLN